MLDAASLAAELAGYEEINLLCGHYEGVDQRILDAKIDREISIGDYILTGGKPRQCCRYIASCAIFLVCWATAPVQRGESFCHDGLLEYPQ